MKFSLVLMALLAALGGCAKQTGGGPSPAKTGMEGGSDAAGGDLTRASKEDVIGAVRDAYGGMFFAFTHLKSFRSRITDPALNSVLDMFYGSNGKTFVEVIGE